MTTRPQIPVRRRRRHLILASSHRRHRRYWRHRGLRDPLGGAARIADQASADQLHGHHTSSDWRLGSRMRDLVTAADVSTAIGEPMTQIGGEAADCA